MKTILIRSIALCLLFVLIMNAHVIADEDVETSVSENNNQQDSASYPGKISRDSEGNKIKRWSTSGPVKVSPPPQPFDDPELKKLPPGTFINVDQDNLNLGRRQGPAHKK